MQKEQVALKKEEEKPKKTSKAGSPLTGWDMTASPECEKKMGRLDFTEGPVREGHKEGRQ